MLQQQLPKNRANRLLPTYSSNRRSLDPNKLQLLLHTAKTLTVLLNTARTLSVDPVLGV